MKNWFHKNIKVTKIIIKILLSLLIIGWIFGMFADYGVDEKVGQWHYDTPIGNNTIVKDDISLSYSWENGSKIMHEGRFSPQTKLFKELLSFHDGYGFVFAIVSITNNGDKDESISLRDFKSRDGDGAVIESAYFSYYPASTLDPIEYILDKQKEKIYTFSDTEDFNITLLPKTTKKIAILFRLPIDLKLAGLSVGFK